MAEINIFHYLPGNSLIHRLDSRIKLVCMIWFSVTTSFMVETPDYLILTAVLLGAFWMSGLPVLRLIRELRYFYILILMVVIIQACSVPGTPFLIRGISMEGLKSGLFFGWRLILVIIIGIIFTGTTRLSSLRNAVEWLLRPLPFIPAARVGTMISLTFVLIPLIFDQAAAISDAQKARCVEGRKNPVQRISLLVFPLLTRIFIQADEMALAMESRCYTEAFRKVEFKTDWKDWLILGCAGLICGAVIWL
jgi:energy-coupling factor transporter transmembrane protein EcfT